MCWQALATDRFSCGHGLCRACAATLSGGGAESFPCPLCRRPCGTRSAEVLGVVTREGGGPTLARRLRRHRGTTFYALLGSAGPGVARGATGLDTFGAQELVSLLTPERACALLSDPSPGGVGDLEKKGLLSRQTTSLLAAAEELARARMP